MAMRSLSPSLRPYRSLMTLKRLYVHADDAVAALGVGVHGLCRLRVEGVHVA